MYVFNGKTWQGGYPDYHLGQGQVRIIVRCWCVVTPLTDIYPRQPRDWRLLWTYFWKVGPQSLIRKVLSRTRERLRDHRFLAMGLGRVCAAEEGGDLAPGDAAVFIAPCHPLCVERVVLPRGLTAKAPPGLDERLAPATGILYLPFLPDLDARQFEEVAGWSEHSGRPLPAEMSRLWTLAISQFTTLSPQGGTVLPLAVASPVSEVLTPPRPRRPRRLRAVLYGLGNHAKTVLLPNTGPRIGVECIHETDPTQISPVYRRRYAVDSSPLPRGEKSYDVYYIAGFHHTHADLAVHALNQGAWAVVEKPLVTTEEQLSRLLAALREHPGRLFSGFHKRYNRLWALARADLGTRDGEPIHVNYLIYEVSLPRRHWYTWPNSRSRVVSNGCHWLDLFLFLNDFARVTRYALWLGGNLDAHMSVELENGACMSGCLTDIGSRRLGTQDIAEARAGKVTVRVQNDSLYLAEDDRRIIRRRRCKSVYVYADMYRTIGERIACGQPGDSYESVERTSRLMIDLDNAYYQALAQRRGESLEATVPRQ
jgi:predicted dehydrogenase